MLIKQSGRFAKIMSSSYEKFENNNESHEDIIEPSVVQDDIDFRKSAIDMDHIEVSLEDPEDTQEVLTRAADFFVEHNDNFTLSWEEAAQRIDLEQDPSRPPEPGWNQDYVRWRLRRTVESLWFRTFTFLLIVTDIIVVIIDLVNNPGVNLTFNSLQLVDLVLTIWFVIELFLRIVALTPDVFFRR